jgi:cell wall-associated NlpC family hydrolase
VNWATGQIGSTAFPGLCLTFVQDAWNDGAGINLESLTSGVTYNYNTDPEDVWGHFTSGTTGTGTPPPGSLVFFNATAGHDPEDYSHVTIMGNDGEMISSPDTFNDGGVHEETLAQHAASGAWNTYVGWWQPDGS